MAQKKADIEWERLSAYELKLKKENLKVGTLLDKLFRNYRGVRLFRGFHTVEKMWYYTTYNDKEYTGEYLAEYTEKDGIVKNTIIDDKGNYLSGDQPEFTQKKKMGIQELSRLILLDKSNRLLTPYEEISLLEYTKDKPLGKFMNSFGRITRSSKIYVHWDPENPTYRVLMTRYASGKNGGYLLDFTFDKKGNLIESNSKEIAEMITKKGNFASPKEAYDAASKMFWELIKNHSLKPLKERPSQTKKQR